MQFIKTRDVKSPERDVSENAGIDFYIPENTPEFRQDFIKKSVRLGDVEVRRPGFSEKEDTIERRIKWCVENNWSYLYDNKIYIAPHEAIIIPTGIKSKFGPELALIANNKSGIATKKQLIFGASVIDCSYQGEWHINLINTSEHYQTLEFGQKAVQFIPHLISTESVEVVDLPEEEFYTEKTSRGDGWQGSTGVK